MKNYEKKFRKMCEKYPATFALMGCFSKFTFLSHEEIMNILGEEVMRLIFSELSGGGVENILNTFEEIRTEMDKELESSSDSELSEEENSKINNLLSFLKDKKNIDL